MSVQEWHTPGHLPRALDRPREIQVSPQQGRPARRLRCATGGAPPRWPSARTQHGMPSGAQGGEGWAGGRARACASATSRPGKRAAAAAAAPAASAATTQRSMRSLGPPGAAGGSPASVTYQAGMRWPHHSCRLTHQSRMFSSHLRAAPGGFCSYAKGLHAATSPCCRRCSSCARHLRKAHTTAHWHDLWESHTAQQSSQALFTRSAHTKTCGNTATALRYHLYRACPPNSIPSSQHTHQHTYGTTRHEGSTLAKSMLLFVTAFTLLVAL